MKSAAYKLINNTGSNEQPVEAHVNSDEPTMTLKKDKHRLLRMQRLIETFMFVLN